MSPVGHLAPWLATAAKALLVAVAIGLDLFAAGMAVGTTDPSSRRRIVTAVVYAGLGVLFPLLGLALGSAVRGQFGTWTSLAAAVVLVILGLATARTSLKSQTAGHAASPGAASHPLDLTSPAGLAISGIAVSLDAFAVGFSLPLLRIPLAVSLVLIGVVGFLLTVIGLKLGSRIGSRLGARAELLSGLCLTLTGLLILAEVGP